MRPKAHSNGIRMILKNPKYLALGDAEFRTQARVRKSSPWVAACTEPVRRYATTRVKGLDIAISSPHVRASGRGLLVNALICAKRKSAFKNSVTANVHSFKDKVA